MSAKATDGVGTAINVQDFKNIQLQIATDSSANMTIKVQGSLSETEPNFATAASSTNPWDFVAVYDLNDPTSIIPGSTGFAPAGTDICKNVLVNVDAIVWINVQISSRSAGNATVVAVSYNNQ